MKLFSAESKVGLFVIVAISSLIYMINHIKPIQLFRKDPGYNIYVFFDSISGVESKSFITMAGVGIGRVSEISLQGKKARVTVNIRKNIIIRRNSTATIKSQGMLGEKYIEFSGGTKDSPILKDGDILYGGKRPLEVDEVISKLGEVLSNVEVVSKALKDIFSSKEGQQQIQQIFNDISFTTKDLKETMSDSRHRIDEIFINILELTKALKQDREFFAEIMKDIGSITNKFNKNTPLAFESFEKITKNINLLLNDVNKSSISNILEHMNKASLNFEKTFLSINKVINDENNQNIQETITNLKLASAKFDKTLDLISSMSNSLKRGEGTFGKLFADDDVYEKVNYTLDGLNRLVSTANKLKLSVGFRGENLTEESLSKGYFTLKLQPKEDKYYLFEVGEDVRKNTSSTNNSFTDNLLFTIKFHKQYNNLGVNIGFIESSFGLGADYFLYNNLFELNFEAYNFKGYDDSVKNPQIKFSSKLNFLKYFFVYGGLDEVLNRRYRSVFAGVGLNFVDDDFKTMVGVIGIPAKSR